ncbi:MAG: hypothetical protein QOE28_226, partial [Solirubrobacteraceae bacterium]|nr:hypothetical protein [Solirubrobacteraceae bacterium]
MAPQARRRLIRFASAAATLLRMRRISATLAALALAAVLAPAASAQEPVIRPGVTVAGVDVSNQTLSQAAGTIDRAFFQQLVTRNVSVRVGGRGYRLRTKQAQLKFDAAKSARRAYIAGTQSAAPVDVLPYVTYSDKQVSAFVADVAARSRVAPRNATVRITLTHIFRGHSRSGRATNAKQLRADVVKALTDPRAPRALRALRTTTPAKVTAKDLARVYATVITIDRAHFRLRLFKHLRLSKS